MNRIWLNWLCLCFAPAFALYEDQVNQIDWFKPHVGPIDHVVPSINNIYVFSSKTSTLASIDTNTGDLVWKHRLYCSESTLHLLSEVPETFQPMVLGTEFKASILLISQGKGKTTVSAFDALDGTLVWELPLESTFTSNSVSLYKNDVLDFHSKDSNFCASLRSGRQLSCPKSKMGPLAVLKSHIVDNSLNKRLNVEFASTRGNVLSVWKSDHSLFASFSDGSFLKLSRDLEVRFAREESLAFVDDHKVLAFDKPVFDDSENSLSDAELLKAFIEWDDSGRGFSSKFLDFFLLRIQSQIRSFSQIFTNIFEFFVLNINDKIQELISTGGQSLLSLVRSDNNIQLYTVSEKQKFGFLKTLFMVTEFGKVISVDSETGTVLNSVYIPDINQFLDNSLDVLVFDVYKDRFVGEEPPEFVLVTQNKAFFFNALTGDILRQETLCFDTVEFGIVINGNIILGKNRSSPEFCFMSENTLDESISISVSQDSQVSFYEVNQNSIEEIFSVSLPSNHKFVEVISHEKESVNSVGRPIGGGSVMIKTIDKSLSLIVSESEEESLFQLVSLSSGEVIQRYSEKDCFSPYTGVIFENNIVYSCWNKQLLRSEINSLSLYESQILKKYDLNPLSKVSKKDLSLEDVIVEQRSFVVYHKIHDMTITKTLQGISEKRILISTSAGQVSMIDFRLLDPRRPSGTLSLEEKQEGLLQYTPMLPFFSTNALNYFQRIEGDDIRIHTFDTRLESTTLMVAFSQDMYMTRLFPSGGFDLLPEEFDKHLLVLTTGGLFIAVNMMTRALTKKRLESAWK